MATENGTGKMAELSEEMLAISDPEEMSQKKRINQILSRREQVIDARNEAIEAHVAGQLSKEQALLAYQSQIESLIADLWTKFQNSEKGRKMLYEEEIKTVTVFPPADAMPDQQNDLAAGESMPEPQEETIHGLKWFIENKPVVSASFEISTWNPPRTEIITGQQVLDFGTLDEALLKIMEFINETGIDADLEDDAEDAEFDYSDLLDPEGDNPE